MRIGIADNCTLKFSQGIKEHWEKRGHEVRYEIGASEHIAQWADLYYVEWIDNNLYYLWKLYNGDESVSRPPDWDNNKKPKIVCRMIDWDIYSSYVPFYEQKFIDFIDIAICIAPHIQKHILDKAPQYKDKLHLIRPGVDLDKFTFRDNKSVGGNIAMVTGDIWQMKNVMDGLSLFALLVKRYNGSRNWKLHWRGQIADHACYMPTAINHFIKSRGLEDKVILYPPVNDMNEWLEPMQYIINPSIKEAFSYCIAEAMAKGIKPIINNWYGSEDIWPKEYIYNDFDQAITMLFNRNEPAEYRKVIEERYDLKRMLSEFDNLLGL